MCRSLMSVAPGPQSAPLAETRRGHVLGRRRLRPEPERLDDLEQFARLLELRELAVERLAQVVVALTEDGTSAAELLLAFDHRREGLGELHLGVRVLTEEVLECDAREAEGAEPALLEREQPVARARHLDDVRGLDARVFRVDTLDGTSLHAELDARVGDGLEVGDVLR